VKNQEKPKMAAENGSAAKPGKIMEKSGEKASAK